MRGRRSRSRTVATRTSSAPPVVSPDGRKLCLNIGDKSQLYNLATDPYEMNSLYESGRHDDVIAALRTKIQAWQATVKDTIAV